jgi:DNA-binding winged helix-turn-helix (wHTH) protein
MGSGGEGVSASDGGIAFGPFLLDLARGELVRAGELVPLAPKPLALLGYLAANRDRAVPKQELRKQVWPDVFVSEAALASALKDLRRALGDDGARQSVIRTLRRRGYRFVAKLDERPAERSRAAEARARAVVELPKAPPFVARGRELRALTSAAVQAARGRPRVVLITGEAGSGKTRLLEQLLAHPICADLAVSVGRCRADAALPYLPFAEALGANLLDREETTEHLLGEDASILRPLLQPDAPTLTPPDPMDPGHPSHERADLFAAVWKLVCRLAQRGLVLAIEDLHGADAASLELFADLVAAASQPPAGGKLPLLIVATTRPPRPGERLHQLLQRVERQEAFSTLSIAGLGMGATRQLVGSLGLARPTEPTLRAIQLATDGNPLFIREVVREADRSGVLWATPPRRPVSPPTACAPRSPPASHASSPPAAPRCARPRSSATASVRSRSRPCVAPTQARSAATWRRLRARSYSSARAGASASTIR